MTGDACPRYYPAPSRPGLAVPPTVDLACFVRNDEVSLASVMAVPAARSYKAPCSPNSAPIARTVLRRECVDPDEAREVALAFHYDWTLGNGAAAPFDVVDLVTLTTDHEHVERLRRLLRHHAAASIVGDR